MSLSNLVPTAEIEIPVSTEPVRVIGIDLGTTNSAIAEILVTPEVPGPPVARCLDVKQATSMGPQFHTLVPSALAIQGGDVCVGAGAKDLRARIGEFKLELYRNIFWDCKNDMGVRRTYNKAPVGFRSAKEVAGHLLNFLIKSATKGNQQPPDKTVVTVPASFQAAQRRDTTEAAELAGIDLADGALLDEPIAAFIDYAFTHGKNTLAGMAEALRLVVFDFGGGTCDVAIFELRPPMGGESVGIGIAPLSVSRYHRLGGSDIDRKIAVEVLIPQLVEQNGLQSHGLDFRDKSERVIPALLGCAESLKIALCREIARLKSFGRYEDERSELAQTNPGVYRCTLRDGTTHGLKSPTLTAVELDKVLEPFLDRDLLYLRETDYFITCSVFAPLQDALERAGLEAREVDFCLQVGGGALIPQVAEAVEEFFCEAKTLRFDDSEQIQTAVAHGAAWQALSLAVHGKGLVRPITGSSISIQSTNGPVELIADGTELPYPADRNWAESNRLVIPKTSLSTAVQLRVELQSDNDRPLMCEIWTIPPPVSKGDSLRVRYRMDVNQLLHIRLDRGDSVDSAEEFEYTLENPLTSVVNPNANRAEVLDLKERIRTESLSSKERRRIAKRIADLLADLGRYEESLSILGTLNRQTPDAWILTRMGMIAGRIGDDEREEKFYREAARIPSRWNAPMFNLTLLLERQGRLTEALDIVDAAIARESDPPSLILKAGLVEKLDQPKKVRDDLLKRAFALFDPLDSLDDFEFGWYRTGARLYGDDALQQAIADEVRRRREESSESPSDGSHLPETRGEVTKRTQ